MQKVRVGRAKSVTVSLPFPYGLVRKVCEPWHVASTLAISVPVVPTLCSLLRPP